MAPAVPFGLPKVIVNAEVAHPLPARVVVVVDAGAVEEVVEGTGFVVVIVVALVVVVDDRVASCGPATMRRRAVRSRRYRQILESHAARSLFDRPGVDTPCRVRQRVGSTLPRPRHPIRTGRPPRANHTSTPIAVTVTPVAAAARVRSLRRGHHVRHRHLGAWCRRRVGGSRIRQSGHVVGLQAEHRRVATGIESVDEAADRPR